MAFWFDFVVLTFDRTICPMREIKLICLQDAFRLSFQQYPYFCGFIWKHFFFYLRIINSINFADISVSYWIPILVKKSKSFGSKFWNLTHIKTFLGVIWATKRPTQWEFVKLFWSFLNSNKQTNTQCEFICGLMNS